MMFDVIPKTQQMIKYIFINLFALCTSKFHVSNMSNTFYVSFDKAQAKITHGINPSDQSRGGGRYQGGKASLKKNNFRLLITEKSSKNKR